jgi:hypothetical protein
VWQLDNRTPFPAERSWIRDQAGTEIWVVAVKATYDILPDGSTRIAKDQVPVHAGPCLDPQGRYLLHETDLGPPKIATDVLLQGQAHSPTGRPVSELDIGFRVGEMTRLARVFGNRVWQRGLLGASPGDPEPFVSMPLTYTHAWGGDDQDEPKASGNPAGCGIIKPPDDSPWRMPNVEDYKQRLRSPRDKVPVAGFGPVPSHWPWRRQYAGSYDEAWFENHHPLLPQDLDPRHWQIAPPEQQVKGHLRGGEPVVLMNLTRAGFCPDSRLSFQLPRLGLGFETRFYDGNKQRSRSQIHTLIMEPDYPRLSLVHHMSLPCHPKVNLLERTLVSVKQRPLDRSATTSGEEALA